jgi:hypothetical protein
MTAHALSALFAFHELTTRVVMRCMKSSAIAAAIAVAKFILLNHVPLSQMIMVITGLASSGATSLPSIETSSIIIACIPLITSGALLLHNMVQKRGTIEVIESFRATVNRQSFLSKFLHKSALFACGG